MIDNVYIMYLSCDIVVLLFAVCLTCVNHIIVKLDGCGFESHFLYVSLSNFFITS